MNIEPVPAHSSSASLDAAAMSATRGDSRARDLLLLTKPRLNLLVVVTTLVTYYLGASEESSWWPMIHTALGTTLVASGASALNQAWEIRTDALMRRTRQRPLPDSRLRPRDAVVLGLVLSLIGALELWLGTTAYASAVALLTLVSYVLCYTPLKGRTSLSTLVGAIPGALPAVIGWVAATDHWSLEAWALFGIVFMWQMPHFLALAWMYRDDYARAGFPLLPVLEPDGRSTGRQAVLYSAALVPVSLLPTVVGLAGPQFLFGAMALGLVLLWLAVEFAATRTMPAARRLFAGTIFYLPLLWIVLLADRVAR